MTDTEPHPENPRLAAALEYAARGWPVIPLHHVPPGGRCSCDKDGCKPGKHPRTRRGVTDASSDPDTVRGWWARWDTANVGVATGAVAGVWVLGPDGEPGLGDLARLETEHGPLPPTARVRSGSGGAHLYFRWPNDGISVPNRVNHRGLSIDVRGAGGYAVAPPSGNAAGPYTWEEGRDPADAPGWLLDWVRGKPARIRKPGSRPRLDVVERVVKYLAKCPPAVAGRRGHDQLFAVARAVVWGFDLPADLALGLLAEHYNPRCEPPWADTELAHKVSDAGAKDYGKPRGYLLNAERSGGGDAGRAGRADPNGWEPAADEPAEGPPVVVLGADEHRVNAAAAAGLAAEPNLYQRAGTLVTVSLATDADQPSAGLRRPDGAPVVREVAPPTLREMLSRSVRFVKVVKGKDGDRAEEAHPPGWGVAAVHARGHWPGVRPLDAVVTHPLFMPDGAVLAAPGYDPATGLLVAPPPGLAVPVPDRPDRSDVAAAVGALEDVLHDFPFDRPEHTAAWVAGLLTPLAWWAFNGPAPLTLVDGNVRGVGKGLLADVAALTLTGRRFPVMAYTPDRDELRKRITTLAAEGDRLVLLDNLAGPVGNDVLDAALTSVTWKDRLLGGNRRYDGPLHVCWWATGNNVQLGADTARRVSHVRMETTEERPEMKGGFRHPDLRAAVLARRGELLGAALTILRGWHAAGRPRHGLPAWGSYEGWSGVVREAVVFAGLADPGDTRVALQTAADRDAVAMTTLLAGWEKLDPHRRGLTAAAVVEAAAKSAGGGPAADVRGAIEDVCGRLCGRLLGYKLRQFARRNFGGRMVDRAGGSGGANRWVVLPVGPAGGPADAPHPPDPPSGGRGDGGDRGDAPGGPDMEFQFGANV